MILEEADQFTDADLLSVANRAARVVLVAATDPVDAMHGPPANGLPAQNPTSVPTRSGYFQKLWDKLHCDSLRLHYAWARENERLCCTLRPVAGRERACLEIERVADYPDIELRILAIPKTTPQLAEVVFPAGMRIQEAKTFIYRELEEVAVQGLGHGAWLEEAAESFVFHLGPRPPQCTVCVELEKGLQEWLIQDSGQSCCLEFIKTAGWTRAKVDQWLEHHLHLRDYGRTMCLPAP